MISWGLGMEGRANKDRDVLRNAILIVQSQVLLMLDKVRDPTEYNLKCGNTL